jgi:hypothetical protein
MSRPRFPQAVHGAEPEVPAGLGERTQDRPVMLLGDLVPGGRTADWQPAKWTTLGAPTAAAVRHFAWPAGGTPAGSAVAS